MEIKEFKEQLQAIPKEIPRLETGTLFHMEGGKFPILNSKITNTIYDLKIANRSQYMEYYIHHLFQHINNNREWYDEKGRNLIRRIKAELKTRDLKPTKKEELLISEIGSRIEACVPKNMYYSFTRSFDWEPGDYGENSSSCWWGDYNGARTGLEANGGYAILFHKGEAQFNNGKGIGRAWIYPRKISGVPAFIVFNPYGYNMFQASYILKNHLKWDFVVESVRYEVDEAYINSGYANVITPKKINIDYLEDDWSDGWGCCFECEDRFPDQDSIYRAENRRYCQDCYDRLFVDCIQCGTTIRADRVYHPVDDDDAQYCSIKCMEKHCVRCSDCNVYYADIATHVEEEHNDDSND